MAVFKSKYSLSQNVEFIIRKTIFNGKVVGVIFTERGTFYDIEVNGSVYKSISEDDIEH